MPKKNKTMFIQILVSELCYTGFKDNVLPHVLSEAKVQLDFMFLCTFDQHRKMSTYIFTYHTCTVLTLSLYIPATGFKDYVQ